ncbi:MAG TPA: exonuclease domain-containing protein [Pyrinomonadaceae bacterium]|jgi:DNA polymerase III epsilon subunit family exonuclease
MSHPPNLVSASPFAEEAVLMLRAHGGRARVEAVAEHVLQIPCPDPATAALLVSSFADDDWRLRLRDDHEVELDCDDDECRPLDATDFVVFDVETTGSKIPPSRLVEIGAYRVSGGRIVSEFTSLVNPQTPIPPFISSLTGISDAMVAAAPAFDVIAAELLDFVGKSVLVAHNSSFDVRFLNYEVGRAYPGRKMCNAEMCTVSLSRRVVPALANHRLHTVAAHFGVSIRNRHRAPGDARATAEVFIRLLDMLRDEGVGDIAGARRFRAEPEPRTQARATNR